MIRLTSRRTVLQQNKHLLSTIYEIQKAMYDYKFSDDTDDIERRDEAVALQYFDALGMNAVPVAGYYKTISINHNDLNSYANALSEKLTYLLLSLNIRHLVVLGHQKHNYFFNRTNNYFPLKQAREQFVSLTGNPDYMEAFEFDIADLPQMVNMMFWTERCDPQCCEYIYFADAAGKLAFFLCKDGNVHTVEYEKEILTEEILSGNDWHLFNGTCQDKFTDDGAIEGRIITI